MASTGKLEAATQDRKARLAQLRGLKRKAPEAAGEEEPTRTAEPPDDDKDAHVAKTYLSGRNYDTETRGPKLGFEAAPDSGKDTLEIRAAALEIAQKEEAAKEEATKDEQIDLFKLQPKKPNWDLKRDLKERTEVLDLRTRNAIARLVRERLENEKNGSNGERDGEELLDQVRARERIEEEEMRREREEDAET